MRHLTKRAQTRPENSAKKRVLAAALVGVLAGSSLVGCDVSHQEEKVSAEMETTAFKPVLTIEHLMGLSTRTRGRLIIESAVFHAPSVQIQNGSTVIADLVELEKENHDPLFFHYDSNLHGASQTAVGETRNWAVEGFSTDLRNNIAFQFKPLAEIQDTTGEDSQLRRLSTHTAFISGFVMLESDEASHEDQPEMTTRAQIAGKERVSSGDPDGAPATGDPDGAPATGDPDGAPATGDPDGAPATGDPDGAPAMGDPDGAPASGDSSEEDDYNDMNASFAPSDAVNHEGPSNEQRSYVQWVPFVIYIDAHFQRSVSLQTLPLHLAKTGDVIPVELKLDLNELFTDELLDTLENHASEIQAGDTESTKVVLEHESTGSIMGVGFMAPEEETEAEDSSRPIRISGDRRPEQDTRHDEE